MNARLKRRLVAVSGIVIIVLIIVLAVVGGSTAAKTISVAEAAEGASAGEKVQVTGNVVENSFSTEGDVLTFSIYDPDAAAGAQLRVRYTGAASSTFGNDVTAICTGKIGEDGVLACSELVTKCPSKYENADSALSVSRLLGYGDDIVGTVVKVAGTVKPGTLAAAGAADERFALADAEGEGELPIAFDGALSDEVTDGAACVVTGHLGADGAFVASDVALEG